MTLAEPTQAAARSTDALPQGTWPVMLTPFTQSGDVDHDGLAALVEWYLEGGAAGLFALCLSSESFELKPAEKAAVLATVVRCNDDRVPIVAGTLGGPSSQDARAFRDHVNAILDAGVVSVVLSTSEICVEGVDEEAFIEQLERTFELVPNANFGLYECPKPYKRLIGPEAERWAGASGRVSFVKDTCCDRDMILRRRDAWGGTPVQHFDAFAPNLLFSMQNGADGYSGIGSNLFTPLTSWLCDHFAAQPELADRVQAFLTKTKADVNHRYPTAAKAYLRDHAGLPIGVGSRMSPCDLDGADLDLLARLASEAKDLEVACGLR